MRPIKLTMSAFSSYAGVTVLNMDELGNNGLYLITGETGAGKTTIFDAIIFALYGKPSGNNRKPEMLRSKYADPKADTWVELEFEYRKERYVIRRNPPYRRLKKNSTDETTPQAAGATLTRPDGKVFSGINEVDAEIKRIIGIDRDQFSQIAMIAQGDFLKLLTATTEVRQEIFRKIFSTWVYRDIQDKLRERNTDVNARLADVNSRIMEYIKNAECDSESEYAQKLLDAKNNAVPAKTARETISKIIETDTAEEKKTAEETAAYDTSISQVVKKQEKAESYNKARANLKTAEENLKITEGQLSELEAVLKARREKLPYAEEKSKEIALLQKELEEYTKLDTEKDRLKMLTEQIDQSKLKQSDYERRLTEISAELAAIETELKELENAGEQKAQLILNKNEIAAKTEKLKKLISQTEEMKRLEGKHSILAESAEKALAEKNRLDGQYTQMYNAFFREQAGIIAETMLEENKPCPVCGSTHHPDIAKKSADAPTEAELKKAENAVKKAQNTANEIMKETADIYGQLTTVKTAVLDGIREFDEGAEIEKAREITEGLLNCANARTAEIDRQIEDEEKRINRKNTLSALLPVKQGERDELIHKISDVKNAVVADETLKTTVESTIAEIGSKLKFDSFEKAQDEIRKGSLEIQEIRKSVEKADEDYRKCENSINTIKGNIQQLQNQLSEGGDIDLETVNKELSELTEKRKVLQGKQKVLNARNARNISVLSNLSDKLTQKELIEKEFELVNDLHKTANGLVSKQDKVMLETYVQMVYFDKIIRRANYRLNMMTGGQYELRRRSEAANARSQSGLELEIIDRYNNSIRDVKSLSGGESFKASLALALGLSDEIEKSAGGIKLDSMFIDEGFGSLDENSLQQAINALAQLTGETHLVGIISHVSELKRKIFKQIVVTKDKKGDNITTTASIIT